MSIQTEVTRLQGLRNAIRGTLIAWGVMGNAAADLEECSAAIGGVANKGAVTGSISSKSVAYNVPAGYHNGSGKVSIADAEQDKLVPGNIKAGVTVLGVAGSYAGGSVSLQEKSVTPTKAAQTITADDGYDGLSKVDVGPIPSNYGDVSGVTAGAGDVLANKIIVNSAGESVAGTMVNNGAVAATIDGLTLTSYTVPKGYHSGLGTVSLTNDIETALAAI